MRPSWLEKEDSYYNDPLCKSRSFQVSYILAHPTRQLCNQNIVESYNRYNAMLVEHQ